MGAQSDAGCVATTRAAAHALGGPLFRSGTVQRAEAALAAARALGVRASYRGGPGNRVSAPLRGGWAAARAEGAEAEATLDSVLGVEGPPRGVGRGIRGASSLSAPNVSNNPERPDQGPGVAPGPDFWAWAPPAAPEALGPQLQRASAALSTRRAAEVLERPRPSTLPPLQSDAEAPSWQEALLERMSASAPPLQSAAAAESPASSSSVAAAVAQAADALRHADLQHPSPASSAASSGTRADGSRWWSESGEEEQAEGRLCRWTAVRGCSADGRTEWQEKWWTVSDSWSHRSMGSEKAGRCADGCAWREAWCETSHPDAATGLGHIARQADKWATDVGGAQWCEAWSERFWADGHTERDADKWAHLAPGCVPQDGHASVWHERWGERWDGKGGASKWTDRWAERAEREGGGPPRRWGDKWTQEFAPATGAGGRWGESWSDDAGGQGWYSRKWSEDHYGDGKVRKWGQATDGKRWEHTVEEATEFEARPAFGWAEAYSHSPQLLAVPLRKAPGGEEAPGVLRKPGARRPPQAC